LGGIAEVVHVVVRHGEEPAVDVRVDRDGADECQVSLLG
jgi:hypothetical protein